MNEEEKKAFQDIFKKSSKSRRASETPEQTMDNYEKHMEEIATSDTPNKLKKMQQKVKTELEHIPDWPEPQNDLRSIYNTRRMHSLGKKAISKQTAKEVLEGCISRLKDDYPDFQFKYDEDFFSKCG